MPYCCESIVKPHSYNCRNKKSCQCSLDEYRSRYCVPPFSIQSHQRCAIVCPFEHVKNVSKQIYRSENFRLYYERGDLPCTIEHITKGQSLKWFINDFQTLNIDYYLPIFIDGLCETKYPFNVIALQGSLDLIEHASHKITNETLSKLILPLKRALYTNDSNIIRRVLIVLDKLARGNDGAIGISLVPYFNQLLPIINIIKQRNQEKFYRNDKQCHIIDDYGQNIDTDLNRLIDQTLVTLEQYGGQDAFINIKYSIPTYEQQADLKQLTSAQTNEMIRPFTDI